METAKKNSFSILWGILFSIIIAIPAWWLGQKVKLVGGPVFGILFGLIIAFWKRPKVLESGIKFSSKKILQYAIILLGFGMNINQVLSVGSQSILVIVCTLTAAFLTAWLVGKALKLPGKTTTLIGVGTAICGGSAIAATAPVIDADDQDVAYAISTIFLFNIIACFIFPPLGRLMGMSDTGFGMWAGTAINDTSSVTAAAGSFSDAAYQFATVVKLTRTLMIIPITLVLALVTSKKKKAQGQQGGGSFNFVKIFPWFILGFIAASVICSLNLIPADVSSFLNQLSKFGIVVAMVAIGLNTNIKQLVSNGMRPIVLGLSCWFAVAIVSLIVQHFIGLI